MGPLSHKNLPLAMFLEKDDLGYTAWTGSKNSYMTDSDIIQYLGVGIVSFKEPEEEVEVTASDYEYRVDTDVYTSITVTGGEHTPDNPVTVRFYIKNKVYTVSNIVYPKGASQLVWCKWHTPNTEQTVKIRVTVTGGASASKTNITASIVDLNKNPPPDPSLCKALHKDGWGEGYEQREIKLGDDTAYISFWNSRDDYFLKPESEVFPEQKFDQTMGGI